MLQASALLYDEQDLTQFLGEAEDAQATAEQGWHEAQQNVGILREFIQAHDLEVPDCHTQCYDDDHAEVGTDVVFLQATREACLVMSATIQGAPAV